MQIVMPRGELQVHVAKDNGILRDVPRREPIRRLTGRQTGLWLSETCMRKARSQSISLKEAYALAKV